MYELQHTLSKTQSTIGNADHQALSTRSGPCVAPDLNVGERGFVPSPDEVARRAYFTYVNEGSKPGRDVQHWLEAEQQLLAERNLTRVHGYHNRT